MLLPALLTPCTPREFPHRKFLQEASVLCHTQECMHRGSLQARLALQECTGTLATSIPPKGSSQLPIGRDLPPLRLPQLGEGGGVGLGQVGSWPGGFSPQHTWKSPAGSATILW